MVSTLPLLDLIAARLSPLESSEEATNPTWAMASLISPSLLVTPDHVLGRVPGDPGNVVVHFDRRPEPYESLGKVIARDDVVDFAVMTIEDRGLPDVPAIPLSRGLPLEGSNWESLLIVPAAPGGVRVSGEVVGSANFEGRASLQLRPYQVTVDPRGMSGAPVLVDGRLVAIMAGAYEREGWRAVPFSAMAAASGEGGDIVRGLLASASGRVTVEGDGPAEPGEAFFGRLTVSSREAFGEAEGIRAVLGLDAIHMEYLVFGLFKKENGPTRALLEPNGIDEPRLRKIIGDLVSPEIPRTWVVVPLYSLPPVSKHTREAIVAAREVADRTGSDGIRSRHLLYGALSVEGCRLINKLLDQGVRKEDIDLGPAAAPQPTRRRRKGPVQAPTQEPPRSRLDVRPRAIADLPTDEDTLDLKPLVNGLHALLDSKDTHLPLAIAVTAPWGGGKSSVMKQLQRRLKHPPEGHEPYRRWHTVWFEAWKYEKSERLWAALAKEIYEQPQEEMKAFRRVWFRLRVEWQRQTFWSFVWRGLGPPVAAAVAAGITVANTAIPDGAASLLPVGTLVASAGHFWGVLSKPFKRAIDGYVDRPRSEDRLGFTREADADVNKMIEALLQTHSPPIEEAKEPFPPLIRMWRRVKHGWSPFARGWAASRRAAGASWSSIRSLWTTRPRARVSGQPALIVFVDDLDRCNTRHVVEIVEAINQIFNATGQISNANRPRECVFILGMDRDVVASSIDVAYGETISYLEKRHSPLAASFGLEFLAKLVQISVAIPKPQSATLRRLLAILTGNELPPDGAKPPPELVNDYRQIVRSVESLSELDETQQQLRQQAAEGTGLGQAVAGDPAASESGASEEQAVAAIVEAVRERRASLLGSDSPEVWAAEREAVDWLGRNPRQLKRFDNAYRLQLHVASNWVQELNDPDQFAVLAKWVAIRLRWPALAMAVDSSPELLQDLEEYANAVKANRQIPDPWKDQYGAWFANQPLLEILKERKTSRRLSRLSDAFLNVT